MSAMTADAVYGRNPLQIQPTNNALPEHVGMPEPSIRTVAHDNSAAGSPVLAIVVVIGLVIVISQLAVRGDFEIGG